jgi:hypothetical protein
MIIFAAFLSIFAASVFAQQVRWLQSWPYQTNGKLWKGVASDGSEVWGWDNNGDSKIDIYRYISRNGSVTELHDADNNNVPEVQKYDTNGDGVYETWDYDRNQDQRIDAQYTVANQSQTWAYDTNNDGHFDSWKVNSDGDGTFEEERWYDTNGVLNYKKQYLGTVIYAWDADGDQKWEKYTYVYDTQQGKIMVYYEHNLGPAYEPTSIAYGKDGTWLYKYIDTNGDWRPDTWVNYSGQSTTIGGNQPSGTTTGGSTVTTEDQCVMIKRARDQAYKNFQTAASTGNRADQKRFLEEYTKLDEQFRIHCASQR